MFVIEARKGSFVFWFSGSGLSGSFNNAMKFRSFELAVQAQPTVEKIAKAENYDSLWIREV